MCFFFISSSNVRVFHFLHILTLLLHGVQLIIQVSLPVPENKMLLEHRHTHGYFLIIPRCFHSKLESQNSKQVSLPETAASLALQKKSFPNPALINQRCTSSLYYQSISILQTLRVKSESHYIWME